MTSRLDMGRVFEKYSSKVARVVANVHDFEIITPTLAKVVVNFNTADRTVEEARTAIAAAFENQLIGIEGSFRSLKTNLQAAVGFMRTNREVKEYKAEMAGKYKTMSSNLLMDPEDQSLWEVKSSPNGNKYIVRQDQEDLSELLVTSSVRGPRTPSLSVLATATVAPNEYLAFVNPRLEEMGYGYVVEDKGEELVIASRDGKMMINETINKNLIVEAAWLNGNDKFKAVAAPSNLNNKSAMLEYYKQVFSYSPEYFTKLEEIINSHAAF